MKKPLRQLLLVACVLLSPISHAQQLDGPADGFARVYFFHFLAPMTGRFAAELYADRSFIGYVDSSHTYGFDLAPGEHVLWSKAANQKWFLKANLDAGKTYYVHVKMQVGTWNPKFSARLHPASTSTKKRQKILKKIKSRLAKNKFTVMPALETRELAEKTIANEQTIDAVLAQWESEWSVENRWMTLSSEDAVD